VDVLAEPRGLTGDDCPVIYCGADAHSFEGQRRYSRATSSRLAVVLLVAAAGAVAPSVSDWTAVGWVGAVAFVAAAFVEMFRSTRSERRWCDGRAAADQRRASRAPPWRAFEARQHGTVATTYAVAHHELGLIEAQMDHPLTEEVWARIRGSERRGSHLT
jgi:SMODS and SLOG-associating 2TM effector domain 3